MLKAININDKLNKFSDLWSPRVIAEMNDYQFKLAKVKGEFVWHSHVRVRLLVFVCEFSIACRGLNSWGQLGRAAASDIIFGPNFVDDLTNEFALQVSVGSRHMCTRVESGHVYCW